VLKPPKFDGTSFIDTFLIQFAMCADYNEWDDEDRCAILKCSLTGDVGQILWDSRDSYTLTYGSLIIKLKFRYGNAEQKDLFAAQQRIRKRGPTESLAELYIDVCRLMTLAY